MDEKSQNRVVVVYGSAGITPDTPDWQIAYDAGRYLAQAGYDVLTGGYSGVMEAASQGACDVGGHVIGSAIAFFEVNGLRPNSWVHEIVRFETLRERLFFLVQKPDAFVALRGGVGTLSEVALVWSLLEVGELAARPFVLVGPMWRDFVEVFAANAAISPAELRWLTLVDTPDQIVPALQAWWASPPNIPRRVGDVSANDR